MAERGIIGTELVETSLLCGQGGNHQSPSPTMDLDPKNLIPMVWIGELWRLSALPVDLVCYATVPALGVAAAFGFVRRQIVSAVIATVCIGIILLVVLRFSPDYMAWLLD